MRVLLDLVAPRRCAACRQPSPEELCASCARALPLLGAGCPRCGGPEGPGCCLGLRSLRRARSLTVYAGEGRAFTLALKRGLTGGAGGTAGALLGALARREGLEGDTVTWVPGAAGGGAPEVLARGVGAELGRPVLSLLRRAAAGPRQAEVPLARRRINVAGRFAASPVFGGVLLVDDVFTTGATTDACAGALRQAGAEFVDVVTWARTLLRSCLARPSPSPR